MCVINKPVFDVNSTKLLIAKLSSDQGTPYQIISYVNKIKLNPMHPNNAMILAVPCKAEDIIVSENKQDWTTPLLKEMFNAFEAQRPLTRNSNGIDCVGKGMLKIETAGSYVFSRANSLDELLNFDKNEFEVDPKCWEFLESYYADKPFSFLILKLSTSGKYHPFNYAFPTQTDTELIVPTLHYHAHEHKEAKEKDVDIAHANKKQKQSENEIAHYDHEIYVVTADQLIESAKFLTPTESANERIPIKHYNIAYPGHAASAISWIHTIANCFFKNTRIFFEDEDEEEDDTELKRSLCFTGCARAFAAKINLKGNLKNADFIINLGAKINQTKHDDLACAICGNDEIEGSVYQCTQCKTLAVCNNCHLNFSHLCKSRFSTSFQTSHDPQTHHLEECD